MAFSVHLDPNVDRFAMATGWLVALGGTTAIDTLASASFTGSKDPHDLGIILQRAFVVLICLYFPIVVIWGVSEPLFIALGQERWLAHDASRFLSFQWTIFQLSALGDR